VGRGEPKPFGLEANGALAVLSEAIEEAKCQGLPWPDLPFTLQPSADLRHLVIESRRRSMALVPKG